MEKLVTSIDLTVLKKCDFVPVVDGNSELLGQLRYLRGLDVHDAGQVHHAICALEIIGNRLTEWSASFKGTLDEEDMECFLELFRKHLAFMKKYEGVHFERAASSYRMCLRMLQVIFGMLYEVFAGDEGLPGEIRGMV